VLHQIPGLELDPPRRTAPGRVDADPQAAVRVRLAQVGEQRLAAGAAGEGEGLGHGDLPGARVTRRHLHSAGTRVVSDIRDRAELGF